MQIQFGTLYNGCTVVLKICILYCGISLQEDGWTDGQRDMLTLIFAVLFSSVALPEPQPLLILDTLYVPVWCLGSMYPMLINTFWRSSASTNSRGGRYVREKFRYQQPPPSKQRCVVIAGSVQTYCKVEFRERGEKYCVVNHFMQQQNSTFCLEPCCFSLIHF